MASLLPLPSTLPLRARGSRPAATVQLRPPQTLLRCSDDPGLVPALKLQWVVKREQLGAHASRKASERHPLRNAGAVTPSVIKDSRGATCRMLDPGSGRVRPQITAAWNAVMENRPKCLILFCSVKLRVPNDADEHPATQGRFAASRALCLHSAECFFFPSKETSTKELNFISADRGGWINVFLVGVLRLYSGERRSCQLNSSVGGRLYTRVRQR